MLIEDKISEKNYDNALKIIEKQQSILGGLSPSISKYKVNALIGMKLYDEALLILDNAIEFKGLKKGLIYCLMK